MAGLSAHRVRETQTIPAETIGTGKEIVITDEYWYTEDLRINLVIKHNDPRSGSVAMTVTQVTLSEPDPALFRIPDDYTPPDLDKQRNNKFLLPQTVLNPTSHLNPTANANSAARCP
jgi:hypothetical protein